MKKISVLIIDDEELARQRLINLVKDISELNLLGTCKTGKEAIKKINNNAPDLIFLDIQLKDMSGFDVLERLEVKPTIIFITAYNEYALKAFDYFAFDYLLKPFKDSRFYQSIENIKRQSNKTNTSYFNEKITHLLEYIKESSISEEVSRTGLQKLPIKLGNKVSFIDTKQIKYICAAGYYAEIYTNEKKYLLRESLTSLSDKLEKNTYIRIHRSTIINVNFILEIIHSSYGELDIKITDGKLFRVSKGYKKQLQKRIGI